jgi:hypothetical protein
MTKIFYSCSLGINSMYKSKKNHIFTGFSLFFVLVALVLFNNIEKILYDPLLTPEEWLNTQPWIELRILTLNFVLVQPTSTLFVYLLGILSIGIGLSIFKGKNNQHAHEWWGVALILWGLGALFAGTSYQAFSYEIKCVGREFCLWTSWWEVFYMILSVGSVNAMMVAQAYSCVSKINRNYLFYYAVANLCIYTCVALIGSIFPVQFLISFELMIAFIVPSILFFFILNLWRYRKDIHSADYHMDRALMVIWISLGLIMASYYLYLILDITNILWEKGIWFSENDVLHIGLIFWMIYIRYTTVNYVEDFDHID